MKRKLRALLILACAVLFTQSAAFAEISDKQFEDMMGKYLGSEGGKQAVGKAVETYFMQRQQEARKKQDEQQQKEMEDQFKNPVKIDPGSSPVKGPSAGKITVIEFSDFQCPFCKKGKDIIEELMKAYPQDVKVYFKHLPLPFHEQAAPAARAAFAAHKQGKFWEMHDALFSNQGKLSPEFFLEQAKTLGLDIEKFKTDMASEEAGKTIKDDEDLAHKYDIQGTPAFFVNGVLVRGAFPIEHFKRIIDRHLGKGDGAKAQG